MDTRSAGLLFIIVGIGAILVGLLVYSGALSWFGRLPGDIRVDTPKVHVFIPMTSMLLVSLVLSVLAALLRRFF